MAHIKIGDRFVGENHPTYFIAEIGSNHDGDLERAKSLIRLAKACGADAVKFQNFHAASLISAQGFQKMKTRVSHQAAWKKSVFDVYREAETPDDWTPLLKNECDQAGLHYFSAPYDFESTDLLEPYVPAYKVGSGDIDWLEALVYIAKKGKPVILSTGASSLGEVQQAVWAVRDVNPALALMQCNTNYTGNAENFKHIHLNVLRSYAVLFPDVVLGLSDHTAGLATCLGAVTLGARLIEKHFTDDPTRVGPDHAYAMSPNSFKDMIEHTRELELALGSSDKFVAGNEQDTVFIQRRCLRAARDIAQGEVLTREMLAVLRPAEPDALRPPFLDKVLHCSASKPIAKGEAIKWSLLAEK
jgi:N-acetylneuraminate synthase